MNLTDNLTLRPFGQFEKDLDIDFGRTARPVLVTRILECCIENETKTDQDFFWDLTVGKRIEYLFTLAGYGNIHPENIQIRCSNNSCREFMEIELEPGSITAMQRKADASKHCEVPLGDDSIVIRKPTGRDQLVWLENQFKNDNEAIKAMASKLIVDKNPTEQEMENWIQSISSAMEEFDPLVDFGINVSCPYCGNQDSYEIDLEELALRKLQRLQLELVREIHCLASHYHWTERDILSLPPWRRSYYLDLIDKEVT